MAHSQWRLSIRTPREAAEGRPAEEQLLGPVTSLTGDAEVSLQAFILSVITRTSALFSNLHRGRHSVDTGLPKAPRTSHRAGDFGCHPVWAVVLWAVVLPPIAFGDHERDRDGDKHTHRETKKWGRGKSARHRKGTRLKPTGDPSRPFPLHSSLLIPVYPVLAISVLLTAQSDLFLELGRMEPQCVLPTSRFCTVPRHLVSGPGSCPPTLHGRATTVYPTHWPRDLGPF